MWCGKFVNALVCEEHLSQCIAVAQTPPRFLNHNNVFWFSNWWAEAIWCAKGMDESNIMIKWMLLWQVEALWVSTRSLEYCAVVVKSVGCILQFLKQLCIVNLSSSYITEIYKSTHCLHHLRWYMAFNSWQIDLVNDISLITTLVCNEMYLH